MTTATPSDMLEANRIANTTAPQLHTAAIVRLRDTIAEALAARTNREFEVLNSIFDTLNHGTHIGDDVLDTDARLALKMARDRLAEITHGMTGEHR